MVIGIVVIWGGLALSILNLFKKRRHKEKTSAPQWCGCFFLY
ncbi:MetS family NSS transporter small subunit [Bacillus bingmayongensis]|nr:MetS family NSS transporter small subunit [Bacillus bingmayongensis]